MPRKIKINKYCLLLGARFNKLTVLDREEFRKEDNKVYVRCRCDCGKEKSVMKSELLRGLQKSCGCLSRVNCTSTILLGSFLKKYRSYIIDAKKRHKEFFLSKEEFLKLTQQNCFYCGAVPKNISRSASKNNDFIYNGIDRVDCKRGYELNNCVPCCTDCNVMKYVKSIPQFLEKCNKIYNFMNKKIFEKELIWQYCERE